MNITLLLDCSYTSVATSAGQCSRLHRFVADVINRMSLKTENKFRLGAFGATASFLCCTETLDSASQSATTQTTPRTDFVYQLRPHLDTPHQVWTEDTKAELLFLLKGQPFQNHGHNDVRGVLKLVTCGPPQVSADHVFIFTCWPLSDTKPMLSVIRQTASVTVINLKKRNITSQKTAYKLQNVSEKYSLTSKNKSRTPHEDLQYSMIRFLQERAPVLLEEAFGPSGSPSAVPAPHLV